MVMLAPRHLIVPGSQDVLPWWVGPDVAGRWHVALAPWKPNADSRTLAPAVCGRKPNALWFEWKVWARQEHNAPRGAAVCATCLDEAQQHDWPRPAGLMAKEA